MNKKIWIILLCITIVIAIGLGAFFIFKNNNNKSYTPQKVSTTTNTTSNTNKSTNTDNSSNKSTNTNQENILENNTNITSNNNLQTSSTYQTEEKLTTFSTKIVTKNDSRQNNINITCSQLNNTLIQNGETFSFCDTLGPSTSEKGYQEADIFDNNGKKKKGLGGGNCQVSTTLYNAVLAVPNLIVTERHKHSNYVPYIEEGKDAAVAYGSYDLKFRNNTGNTIKIKAESTTDAVTITLIKLS